MENATANAPKINTDEKNLLVELVKPHLGIVESKITNHVTVQVKDREWMKIAIEWAAKVTGDRASKKKPDGGEYIRPRNWKQIKKSWENLKSRAKKDQAEERRQTYATGGGQKTIQVAEQSSKIADMCRSQFEPLENPYDDDYIPPPKKALSSASSSVCNVEASMENMNTCDVTIPSSSFSQSSNVTAEKVAVDPTHTQVHQASESQASVQGKKSNIEKYLSSIPNPPAPPESNLEISKGSKRKAENFIMGSAEEEHKLRVSVLENENNLIIKKSKIADLKLQYWQSKLQNVLYNLE